MFRINALPNTSNLSLLSFQSIRRIRSIAQPFTLFRSAEEISTTAAAAEPQQPLQQQRQRRSSDAKSSAPPPQRKASSQQKTSPKQQNALQKAALFLKQYKSDLSANMKTVDHARMAREKRRVQAQQKLNEQIEVNKNKSMSKKSLSLSEEAAKEAGVDSASLEQEQQQSVKDVEELKESENTALALWKQLEETHDSKLTPEEEQMKLAWLNSKEVVSSMLPDWKLRDAERAAQDDAKGNISSASKKKKTENQEPFLLRKAKSDNIENVNFNKFNESNQQLKSKRIEKVPLLARLVMAAKTPLEKEAVLSSTKIARNKLGHVMAPKFSRRQVAVARKILGPESILGEAPLTTFVQRTPKGHKRTRLMMERNEKVLVNLKNMPFLVEEFKKARKERRSASKAAKANVQSYSVEAREKAAVKAPEKKK